MRVLLSTIGSRGDVQPLVALGTQLKALGQEVSFCVPPDFRDWIEGLGMAVTPIGPELKSTGKKPPLSGPPNPEQVQTMMAGTVATQFETIGRAAAGCDLIVGATTLQIAAPTIAEQLGIPYVFTAFCPAVLPSPHHSPPVLTMLGDKPEVREDYSERWAQDKARWKMMWGGILNKHRQLLKLEPVEDLLDYVLSEQPWLAADRTLGPWPEPGDAVYQPGAWILPDERPLAPELEAFLAAGEPPIYFGFGSIHAPQELARAMIASARALGRRAILLQGWAELELPDTDSDCIAIGEVNQQALFRRVAAVVHHGGAGTTTAAAGAGTPQVLIPQHFDQFYWAGRIAQLGIGCQHPLREPDTDSLTAALGQVLAPEVAERARGLAPKVRRDGAELAAKRLLYMLARRG